ncbi:Ca-activated chloride channel family protein [Agromyces flavus]|uniref:Ca-activated chloride channel family protein n=1 Tax=Agromyces flavus TaxID=589382 RepID=A0A1H1Z9U9_9MICO|nr:substrate-binding domain-containing protein [Agromyces flavus]MCP2366981.1 Ca-activated chloride channel family protein [Agromyces flavus]GGI46638.1 VWA domain-containing protein [Agromyces flavus]SDT30262.1 Ca-activated chloride channel family protein [Agromyces flavus]
MRDAPETVPARRDRRRIREEGRRRRQRALWIGAAVAVVALLAVGGAVTAAMLGSQGGTTAAPAETAQPEPIVFPSDEPAPTPGTEPCTTVRALSSFENAEMVSTLAEAYNAEPRNVDGSCVTVVATKDKSGIAAEEAAVGFTELPEDERPTLWIPDASSWLGIAREAGGSANVPEEGESIGSSDIVLAMPEELASAIGWDEEPPTWADVFATADDEEVWNDLDHPEWGEFKLGKTSPLVASSGEAAMLASYGAAAGSVAELSADDIADDEITDEVRQHELATSHYMATPEHFLWHARQAEDKGGSAADFLSAVIVDEKSVWDYNRGITSRDGVTRIESEPPAEQLVPIYPTDGFYVADNPAVVLTGAWVDEAEAAAAEDFLRFATTEEGQAIVRETGYRDLNRELDPGVASVGALAETPRGGLAFPEPTVVVAMHEAFPDVRKRANVLFLVDVSGSMGDRISTGATKLEAAKAAISQALDHFADGDHVGLAAFSEVDANPLAPGEVSAVDDIADTRDRFEAALAKLQPIEWTPLYEAVDTFAKQQGDDYDPDRINAIVLLSDGRNETEAPSTTSAQMIATLEDLHHTTPVLVFTLAYGADADVKTLQSISSATGAHYYDATDPTEIDEVLGDLVTSF